MVPKRKIKVYIAASEDGFIAQPDSSVDWLDRPHPKGN
jgi:dihydrofolate reductase